MRGVTVLANRRIFTVTLLGFSSALPLALTGATLQAWFTQTGMSLLAVGAVSLIGMPYIWKFLWSPLLDRFTLPFLDRRRGWILATQLILSLSLFFLANLSPVTHLHSIGLLALFIAFISASQDIAIDAYRTDMLLPSERAIGSSYYIFAYRIALLITGALALILADHIGWRLTYEIMALLMSSCAIITFFAPHISQNNLASPTLKLAITGALNNLFKRDSFLMVLLFILVYKIGDALALSLMSNFLLRTLGFSLTEVAFAYKTVGIIAMMAGALLGGMLLTRMNLYKALLWFGIAQAFSNLMFMLLAMIGKNYSLMTTSIFIESFCSGMSTTALLVFLTSLCHPQYSATQFACLSAIAAVGRVFLGPVAGFLVYHIGWVNFFGWSFLISLPGLFILMLLRKKVTFHVQAMA